MGEMISKQYTTLMQTGTGEYAEKKSVFIGCAGPVKTVEEADAFIAEIKSRHKDARHNVPAFSIRGGAIERQSDDGEPQGTAGAPVLEVIRKSGLNDVCIVVTRYFGGILLGTGGLVRAYTKAAELAVSAARIVTYTAFTVFEIGCMYPDFDGIRNEMSRRRAITDNTEYGSGIVISAALPEDDYAGFVSRINDITSGRAAVKIIGRRYDIAPEG